jgi:replication factor C subunit 2/4
MELNASAERGIDVIRSKVKHFAQVAVGPSKTNPSLPLPPFKLIILDEADSMTPDAQAALRRMMESYSKMTRFCLICNYISRIIEPLTSRCAKFRFKPLENNSMEERLKYICSHEGLGGLSPEILKTIVKISDGDMRKAITYLQSGSLLYGSGTLKVADVMEISGRVEDKLIEDMFKKGGVCRSNSFDKVQSWVEEVVASGFSAAQIVLQIHQHIVKDDSLTNVQKAKISQALGKTDHHLLDGADEYLQLLQLAAFIMRVLCSPQQP